MNTISTVSFVGAPRSTVERARRDLVDAQVEATSGRHVDVGLELGARIGEVLLLRGQGVELEGLRKSSEMVAGRLEVTQSALSSLVADANDMISGLVAARSNRSAQQTSPVQAGGYLKSFRTLMNTAYNGAHVFGGINVDVEPIADYFSDPTSSMRASVQAAFVSHFGFAPDDPAASSITATDLSVFINGDFEALFNDPGWQNLSSASNSNLQDRIASDEIVTTSTNANAQEFRNLAKAYIMVTEFGGGQLSDSAFEYLADTATGNLSQSIDGIGVTQSNLGFAQERVSFSLRIQEETSIFMKTRVGELEDVDAYEVATRLNTITAALEASYAITARIQRLSLLEYV